MAIIRRKGWKFMSQQTYLQKHVIETYTVNREGFATVCVVDGIIMEQESPNINDATNLIKQRIANTILQGWQYQEEKKPI